MLDAAALREQRERALEQQMAMNTDIIASLPEDDGRTCTRNILDNSNLFALFLIDVPVVSLLHISPCCVRRDIAAAAAILTHSVGQGPKGVFPAGTRRQRTSEYEEIIIPPLPRSDKDVTLVPISELDEFAQPAFAVCG